MVLGRACAARAVKGCGVRPGLEYDCHGHVHHRDHFCGGMPPPGDREGLHRYLTPARCLSSLHAGWAAAPGERVQGPLACTDERESTGDCVALTCSLACLSQLTRSCSIASASVHSW